MQILQKSKSRLTSQFVEDFRVLFKHSKDQIQLNSNNSENNQLLLDLYNLTADLQSFFDEPIQNNNKNKKTSTFSFGMEIISERASDKEISSSTLKQGGNEQTIPRLGSKHTASFSSPKHISKQSYDSLSRPDCLETPPSKPLDLEEAIQKYQTALKTITNLTIQKSQLEHQLTEMNDRFSRVEKERQNTSIEKKQCLSLLVNQTQKNNKLDYENRGLLQELHAYEDKVRMLQSDLMEKADLLNEIQQYLREDETKSKLGKRNTTAHFKEEQINMEIAKLEEELEIMISQNQRLKDEYEEMQQSMDSLLRDNEQFYLQISQLKKENKTLYSKNRELVKIQEGKKLNDMVHKENKHLLQVNYELGNKIYSLETENNKLRESLEKVENLDKTYHKSRLNLGTDETLNYTPKAKISFKGSTADRFFHVNISGHTDDNEKSRNQYSMRLEKKNRELENKVQELMSEMNAYEIELDNKKREIQKLNISNIKESQERSRMVETGVESQMLQTFHPTNEQQFMTIKQFCQKFQASPMDALFIMLRVSQLCQSMLENNVVYQLSPTNVYLILDDPDHPENIFVKIEKQNSSKESFLYVAPEIATRSSKVPQQSAVVWNMGMVFYYLLYKSPCLHNIEQIVDESDIKLHMTRFPEAQSIIEMMLERNPKRRIEIKDLLEMIAAEINKLLEEEQEGY